MLGCYSEIRAYCNSVWPPCMIFFLSTGERPMLPSSSTQNVFHLSLLDNLLSSLLHVGQLYSHQGAVREAFRQFIDGLALARHFHLPYRYTIKQINSTNANFSLQVSDGFDVSGFNLSCSQILIWQSYSNYHEMRGLASFWKSCIVRDAASEWKLTWSLVVCVRFTFGYLSSFCRKKD